MLVLKAVALFASLPFLWAKPTSTSSVLFARTEKDCPAKKFYYAEKSCCLDEGGLPSPPLPPPGKACPPTTWQWHPELSCCVPKNKPPPSQPPPQCENSWPWNKNTFCCEQPPPSQPPPAQHSQAVMPPPPGNYNNQPHNNPSSPYKPGKPHYKRQSHKSRNLALCPTGLEACPLPGLAVSRVSNYECLDTYADLKSCGGCASTGQGTDCTAIPGVWNVGCEAASCVVYNCEDGYKLSHDGNSCEKL
ncbi:hypothetical protein SISNIDRAFT_550002 [Sistotremastrum niveocremeum HHB9708]|uniref:Protein CPL1-like domain-containing protein n=1 Tax=Sistotremastrum niveocremeum HHB9708 TaxID=1314777 RepID=A0A164U725_9AGAM|nr:hypothetical protein SISNIDRAFT_550002 [Sistotremastrum niveocremeum HHB9708]